MRTRVRLPPAPLRYALARSHPREGSLHGKASLRAERDSLQLHHHSKCKPLTFKQLATSLYPASPVFQFLKRSRYGTGRRHEVYWFRGCSWQRSDPSPHRLAIRSSARINLKGSHSVEPDKWAAHSLSWKKWVIVTSVFRLRQKCFRGFLSIIYQIV